MKSIHIGQADGAPLNLDPLKLADTRLLVQGNSGGGKSWFLRLLAERTIGHVQTIILDPEGEYATLREKHDLLLVGSEGEIKPNLKAAGLLARHLCELGVSAVVDLYDLQLHDRRKYLRLFLESLMEIPRNLWHPLLIVIDESHLYCPERSAGEADSTQAVIALMSQGRKRGFCGVLATQRLSKLHKDAAAECNNVFIGRTWLDVDQQRAAQLLGISNTDRPALLLQHARDSGHRGCEPTAGAAAADQQESPPFRRRKQQGGGASKRQIKLWRLLFQSLSPLAIQRLKSSSIPLR